jgi:excinuclease ABC subunit C
MTVPEHLQPVLKGIPAKPGCYLMKNAAGQVIYVGKAIHLRNRVRSYFHESAQHSPKTSEMVSHIQDIEWIVVDSELEALILEMNLIKRHKPKCNVRLKDGKRYPYIKISWEQQFPKVTITRRMHRDGSRYFGPFTSVWAVHQSLDVLRKIFPYLTCNRVITGEDARACLYYDIKLCLGPCIGAVDQKTYRAMIQDLCRFLRGDTESIVARLQSEMRRASDVMAFEKAAVIRNQLIAIEKVVEGQKVVSQERVDSDVIAFARDEDSACVQVFFIRSGKLIGREYFLLDGTREAADQELVEAFIKQFYADAAYVPQRLLLPTEIEEAQIVQTWLNQRRGGRVQIKIPRRGQKRKLVQMAAENAADILAGLRASWEADHKKHVQALGELEKSLGLPEPPVRIECYDISNLQGTAPVGSMVVFERGVPVKILYRHFNIKSVLGQDDFASMEEVLNRRFRRWKRASETGYMPGKKKDKAFSLLPDLVIVDGGKGQLGRAVKVLEDYDLSGKVSVASLAKQREEIFIPDKSRPVILPRHSEALYLIQRIRDEAHRFAIKQHRSRRRRKGLASRLDAVPGIGPKRRKSLLQAFGDLDGIRNATADELAAVKGISRPLAERLRVEL